MNFNVQVPEPVFLKIKSWGYPVAWNIYLLKKLDGKLSNQIDGRRIVAPVPCVIVSFEAKTPVVGKTAGITVWFNEPKNPVRGLSWTSIATRENITLLDSISKFDQKFFRIPNRISQSTCHR